MSVINQVLLKLERRGVSSEQNMVRAVPFHRRRRLLSLLALMLLLALALLLASGVSDLQWRQIFRPKQVTAGVIRHPDAAASAVQVIPVEPFTPASRLSFELGSVPLPSSWKHVQRVDIPAAKPKQVSALQLPLPQAAQPAQPPALLVAETAAVPMKQTSTAQRADADYRKAVALMQQGRINEAMAGYEAVLLLDEGHESARQALLALLLEAKRGADAERVLQEGLKAKPEHTGFAMLLARLQMEHGAVDMAAATLEKSLPYADAQPGYQAFFAALLQRQNLHKQAVAHFQAALKQSPENGIWQMGCAISLQALLRVEEAREAYQRALESKTLNPELQAFVQQKLKGL